MGMCFALVVIGQLLTKYCVHEMTGDDMDTDGDGKVSQEEYFKAQPVGKMLADLFAVMSFYLLFLVYPGASSHLPILRLRRVQEDGEDKFNYLRIDLAIDCLGDEYILWSRYALTMMVLYPFGVPCLYALILYRSRHALYRMKRFQLESEDVLNEESCARSPSTR